MINKPAKKYLDTNEELEDLKASGSEDEVIIIDVLESIKDFCSDCPFNEEKGGCVGCYLEKWKEKANEA